ncbi:cation transporter, partial [bacterium]|nr:cation transporter [bacterium]
MHHHHDHSHDHHHGHDHHHSGDHPVRALRKALLVTGCFLLVEFVGGWISNSLALISDAGHMLIDVGGLLLSLFAAWIARSITNPCSAAEVALTRRQRGVAKLLHSRHHRFDAVAFAD